MAIKNYIQIQSFLALMCLYHFQYDRNLALSPLINFFLLTKLPKQLHYCLPHDFFHRAIIFHFLNYCLYTGTYYFHPILAALDRINHSSNANQHHTHCLLLQGAFSSSLADQLLKRVKADSDQRESFLSEWLTSYPGGGGSIQHG